MTAPLQIYRDIEQEQRAIQRLRERQAESFDGGGGGGYDDRMEARLKALELDVATIKTDLAVVKSNYVTKGDLASTETSIIKWLVGTAIATSGLSFAIARFLH